MSSSPAAARRSGTGPAAHVRDGSSGNAKPARDARRARDALEIGIDERPPR